MANYAYLDTGINKAVGNLAPDQYFSQAREQCHTGEAKIGTIFDETLLQENLDVNCIPSDIFSMTAVDYQRFLVERRKLMAKKIRDYYERL